MRYVFSVIAITILTLKVNAERIDGPANIRTEPQGLVFISLFDNVFVDCTRLKNNWYQIGLSIKISSEQYEINTPILEGDTLFDWDDNRIGVALIDIPSSVISPWTSGGAPGNPKIYGLDIFAFTYKSNIKPASIPENALQAYLTPPLDKLTEASLSSFLKDFNFTESHLLDRFDNEFSEFILYENWIDDPSPIDRLRFLFKDHKLIAIIYSRDLNIASLNSYELTRGLKIAIVQPMNTLEREKFIEMNKESYYGVD